MKKSGTVTSGVPVGTQIQWYLQPQLTVPAFFHSFQGEAPPAAEGESALLPVPKAMDNSLQ